MQKKPPNIQYYFSKVKNKSKQFRRNETVRICCVWWIRGESFLNFAKFITSGKFACGEYSCALRLTSELVDLRARNAPPYSRHWREGVRIAPPTVYGLAY